MYASCMRGDLILKVRRKQFSCINNQIEMPRSETPECWNLAPDVQVAPTTVFPAGCRDGALPGYEQPARALLGSTSAGAAAPPLPPKRPAAAGTGPSLPQS